jgi:hypothetical protein
MQKDIHMWFANAFAVLLCIVTTIPTLHATTYTTQPPEKRLQICQSLHDMLQPASMHGEKKWLLSKAAIAILTGAGITYAAHAFAPSNHQAVQLSTQRSKLLKLRNALHAIKASLNEEAVVRPVVTATHVAPVHPIPKYWLALSFTATSGAIYLLLGKLFDKKMQSNTATLKNFLMHWPDLVEIAPSTFCQDVRPLYGAYLRDGDSAIPNERTAELIILAFTVFLTQEIEAISQSLR